MKALQLTRLDIICLSFFMAAVGPLHAPDLQRLAPRPVPVTGGMILPQVPRVPERKKIYSKNKWHTSDDDENAKAQGGSAKPRPHLFQPASRRSSGNPSPRA